uniref:Endoplasmic reticulum membrane sensor NFE2L1 n=1 Tax=Amphilophus citrinellus TaxID=61819 RepID=A0A3Q0S4L6_AMPCI
MGLTAEENTSPFIIDLLAQVAVARMEPENLPGIDANFQPAGFTPALEGNVMTQDLLGSPSGRVLVDEDNDDDLPIPLSDLLEDAAILNEIRLLDLALEEGFNPEMADEPDSDSGLSLDFSHSPASPCVSEASYSSSSSSTSSSSEELGAVGGAYPENENKLVPPNYGDHRLFHGFSQLEHIGHDHTYNQPWSSACSLPLGKIPISKNKIWSRDKHHAQALKIPFSNELIVNLPVEEFNDLLSNYQLNEEQLTLIRDIRRRGKNKIAAQNCRKRKQDVLLGLEDDVSTLRRHRSRLLREKQETLRNLQEMRRQLEMLYKEVFSRLVGEEGSPLDATDMSPDCKKKPEQVEGEHANSTQKGSS